MQMRMLVSQRLLAGPGMRCASIHHHRQWQLLYDFSDCPCHESISVAKNGAIIRWYKGPRIALSRLATAICGDNTRRKQKPERGTSKWRTAAALSYFFPGGSSSFAAILTNSAN